VAGPSPCHAPSTGFSYSKLPYTPGDISTALDNVQFIKGFLAQYPEFQGRQFWLTGESYGGLSLFIFLSFFSFSGLSLILPLLLSLIFYFLPSISLFI
jgi:hypothetical protein